MSLVYAEGFDRHPLNVAIALFKGPIDKAVEVRTYNNWGSATVPNMPTVISYAGRKWIRGFDNATNSTWASSNTPLFLLVAFGATGAEANRPQPLLPSYGNAARLIFQWKVSPAQWNPANTASYFAYFGNQEVSVSWPAAYTVPTKGYWQIELVYDVAIKRLRFYIDGVLNRTYTAVGGTPQLRINLAGLQRYNSTTGYNERIAVYVTDVMVIYDDGIWPSVPLGDANVRDVLMEAVTPLHADAVSVAGENILTQLFKYDKSGLKLVGNGTNVTYKPAATQASLSDDPVCAFVVDTSRKVGTVAGDMDVKIQTASGSNSIKESPTTTMISNLQSVMRIPTKAMTLQAMKDNLRVDLACRAR